MRYSPSPMWTNNRSCRIRRWPARPRGRRGVRRRRYPCCAQQYHGLFLRSAPSPAAHDAEKVVRDRLLLVASELDKLLGVVVGRFALWHKKSAILGPRQKSDCSDTRCTRAQRAHLGPQPGLSVGHYILPTGTHWLPANESRRP